MDCTRTLVTSHATRPSSAHRALQTWSTLEGTQALQRQFLDLGIPDSEAHTYTEAVRQGTTLVVVHVRADQAERGLAMLPRKRPADRQTGHPQGLSLGHVEVISHSDPTRHTAPAMMDTPGVARAQADWSQYQEVTAPEHGLTSLEDEPAYRYGDDIGQRVPAQDWGREKPRSGRAGRRSVAPSTPMDHREQAGGPSGVCGEERAQARSGAT